MYICCREKKNSVKELVFNSFDIYIFPLEASILGYFQMRPWSCRIYSLMKIKNPLSEIRLRKIRQVHREAVHIYICREDT